MDDLYRDYILDTTSARATSASSTPTTWRARAQPVCGDELGVHIRVKDGHIEDLRFHGHGCAISQASASIASEELMGMEFEEVGKLDADWAIDLLGIPVLATRRKCALLGLRSSRAPSRAITAGRRDETTFVLGRASHTSEVARTRYNS